MNPHFAAQVVLDSLFIAGVITKKQLDVAMEYIDGIPGGIGMDGYLKSWRTKFIKESK